MNKYEKKTKFRNEKGSDFICTVSKMYVSRLFLSFNSSRFCSFLANLFNFFFLDIYIIYIYNLTFFSSEKNQSMNKGEHNLIFFFAIHIFIFYPFPKIEVYIYTPRLNKYTSCPNNTNMYLDPFQLICMNSYPVYYLCVRNQI